MNRCAMLLPLLMTSSLVAVAGEPGLTPHCGNPLLPGSFADPSVVQQDGKVFVYGTGNSKTLGCWESTNFKNWIYRELNWPTLDECKKSPTSGGSAVWAPSVVQTRDGRFYMYVTVHSEVWVGTADNPLGPWSNLLGDKPLIPGNFRPGYHMIDAEAFIDDDGSAWLYWGSGLGWKNGKCWAVKLKSDMCSFDGEVRDVTPENYFEGPIMVKRAGHYFLMYSQGVTIKDTYQIHYAVGDNPLGPFTEADNSPILVTDKANNVVSPGHHTIFRRDGKDYILYHRHGIPFDSNSIGRQVCVDELIFTLDGRIEKVVPTHDGPSLVRGRLDGRGALVATATASDMATRWNGAACAVDDNYATCWQSTGKGGWLQLDLAGIMAFSRQEIRFRSVWKPHRFRVQVSDDGAVWRTAADHFGEAVTGSPVLVEQAEKARYLRLSFPDDVENAAVIEWTIFK